MGNPTRYLREGTKTVDGWVFLEGALWFKSSSDSWIYGAVDPVFVMSIEKLEYVEFGGFASDDLAPSS